MKRRDFLTKAALAGGLAALQPWHVLNMLGTRSIEDTKKSLQDWDLDAEALPLTSNYTVVAPTLWCNSLLSALTSSSKTTGDATVVVTDNTDPTYIRPSTATNSLKLEVTVAGTVSTEWAFDWTISETLLALGRFSFAYWSTVSSSASWALEIRLSENAGYTVRRNYFPISIAPNNIRAGWNLCTFDRETPVNSTGSPNIANTYVRVRLRVIIPAGATGTWYFSPIYKNGYNRPKVVFTFDDAFASQYTNGFQYMAARNVLGSMDVRTSGVNITDAQLEEMRAAGWSFHTLGGGTGDLTSVTVAAAQDEIRTAQSFLTARGLTYGARTIVYPAGGTNDALDVGMQALGYTNGCITGGRMNHHWDGPEQPMRFYRVSEESVSLADCKTVVNNAVTYGGAAIFYVHNIPDGSGPKTTHQAMVDYAVRLRDSNVLDIVTLQEYIDGLSPVRRRRI